MDLEISNSVLHTTLTAEDFEVIFEEMRRIEINLPQRYPLAVTYDENRNVRIKDLAQMEAEASCGGERSKGRGGNNAAENTKKFLRKILELKLKDHFQDFEQRYFKRYSLKSQKENFILLFMFLDEFVTEQKLPKTIISEVIRLSKLKIQGCISHSQARKDDRAEFQERNIEEISKYLTFNLDFTTKRYWSEIEDYIRSLFRKKKACGEAAINKVLKIIHEHKHIKRFFVDLNDDQEEIEKSESQNSAENVQNLD